MTSSSSSSQHMDFDAKVEYWSSEQQQGHRFKCSQMEVHPTKPLVLSVDQRDGSLCLWDIQLKKALIDAVSVYALFADSLSKRAPPSASSSSTYHHRIACCQYIYRSYRIARIYLYHVVLDLLGARTLLVSTATVYNKTITL